MPLSMSMKMALEKASKSVAKLERTRATLRNSEDHSSFEVDLAEFFNSQALLLDKTMNAIFTHFGDKSGNKPNIYFPACQTKEALEAKLQQYKLRSLIADCPELIELISSCQPFTVGKDGWWPRLRDLSLKRHEEYPPVDFGAKSLGVGVGQDLYVHNLVYINGEMTMDAYASNSSTGQEEPIRLEIREERAATVGGIEIDPIRLAIQCQHEIDSLIKRIYRHL